MTVKTTAALLTLAFAASTADAQARGQTRGQTPNRPAASAPAAGANANRCEITSSGSNQVMAAYEALSKFNETTNDAEKPGLLREAIRQLSGTPDRPGTDLARNWVLAQTLAAYSTIEGQSTVGTRGSFGFASNAGENVDLIAMADSVMRRVQAERPGCAEQIDNLRRLTYVTSVNQAVSLFNAGQSDQAKALAERANQIYAEGAPSYHLLGNVAVRAQDWATAAPMLEKAAQLAENDTTLRELRESALESLAVIYSNQAAAAEGEQQRELGAKAAATYRQLIALDASNAGYQTGLAQALSVAGDTAAVGGIYAQMLANPASYSSMQLIEAGITAANADRFDDAASLLEAGVARNPNYRDALFALTYVYASQNQYAKMTQMAHRLIAVDPNNPDNLNWLSQAYQGMISETRDNNVRRAYTDSMVKTTARAEQMPVRVTFNDFQLIGNGQRVLNGVFENRGAAPASHTIRFEFLDESGTVVTTHEERLADVPARGSKPFSVTVQGQGIVAYRYAPITS